MQKPEYTVEELIEMQRRMAEAQAALEVSKRDLDDAKKGR
jgi:hypothetical protein